MSGRSRVSLLCLLSVASLFAAHCGSSANGANASAAERGGRLFVRRQLRNALGDARQDVEEPDGQRDGEDVHRVSPEVARRDDRGAVRLRVSRRGDGRLGDVRHHAVRRARRQRRDRGGVPRRPGHVFHGGDDGDQSVERVRQRRAGLRLRQLREQLQGERRLRVHGRGQGRRRRGPVPRHRARLRHGLLDGRLLHAPHRLRPDRRPRRCARLGRHDREPLVVQDGSRARDHLPRDVRSSHRAGLRRSEQRQADRGSRRRRSSGRRRTVARTRIRPCPPTATRAATASATSTTAAPPMGRWSSAPSPA